MSGTVVVVVVVVDGRMDEVDEMDEDEDERKMGGGRWEVGSGENRERGRVEESRGAFSNRLLLYSQPYPVVPVPYSVLPAAGVVWSTQQLITRYGTIRQVRGVRFGAGSIKLSLFTDETPMLAPT